MNEGATAFSPADGFHGANAAHRVVHHQKLQPTSGDNNSTNSAMHNEKDDRQDSPMAIDFVGEPLSNDYRGHSLMASQHAPSVFPADSKTEGADSQQHFPALKTRSAVTNPDVRARTPQPAEQTPLPAAENGIFSRLGQTFAPKRVFTIPSPTVPYQSLHSGDHGVGRMADIVGTPLTEVPAPDRTERRQIFEVNLDGSTMPITSLPMDVVWYRPSTERGESIGPYVGLTGVRGDAAARPASLSQYASHERIRTESEASGASTASHMVLRTDQNTMRSPPQHGISRFKSQPSNFTAGGLFRQPPEALKQPASPFSQESSARSMHAWTSFGQPSAAWSRPSAAPFQPPPAPDSQPLSPFGQLPSPFASAPLAQSSFGQASASSSRPAAFSFGKPSTTFARPTASSSDPKPLPFGQASATFGQHTGFFGAPSTAFGRPAASSSQANSASEPSTLCLSAQRAAMFEAASKEESDSAVTMAARQQHISTPITEELEDGEIETGDAADMTELSPWSRRRAMSPPSQVLVRMPKVQSTSSSAVADHHGSMGKGKKRGQPKTTSAVEKQRESLLNMARDRIVSKNGGLPVVIEAWEAVLHVLKDPSFQRKMNTRIRTNLNEKHRKQLADMQANLVQDKSAHIARGIAGHRRNRQAVEALSKELRNDRRVQQKQQLRFRQDEEQDDGLD